jgi:hypothetical protein
MLVSNEILRVLLGGLCLGFGFAVGEALFHGALSLLRSRKQ